MTLVLEDDGERPLEGAPDLTVLEVRDERLADHAVHRPVVGQLVLGIGPIERRPHFAERFRDVVGETPHQYLTLWRMQRARRLLADSRYTLARIAREVGYESAPSFSRVFRKSVGETPGAYRRRVREAPAAV